MSCLDLLGVDGVAWVQGTGKHSIGYYLDESVVSLPQTGQRLDARIVPLLARSNTVIWAGGEVLQDY